MAQDPDDGEEINGVRCAYCFESAGADEHAIAMRLTWPETSLRMTLYAHDSCLRAAIHPAVPLPERPGT